MQKHALNYNERKTVDVEQNKYITSVKNNFYTSDSQYFSSKNVKSGDLAMVV